MGQESITSGGIPQSLTPKQARLVEEKLTVVRNARELQTQLASVRAELTRIDLEMVKADFQIPVMACW